MIESAYEWVTSSSLRIVGTILGLVCVFGLLIRITSHSPYYIPSDSQYQTAKLSAIEFADKAGMTFLSCLGSGKDGLVPCSMRTYTGHYEFVLCSYKQSGCVPYSWYTAYTTKKEE